jgi:hypothetical protein
MRHARRLIWTTMSADINTDFPTFRKDGYWMDQDLQDGAIRS